MSQFNYPIGTFPYRVAEVPGITADQVDIIALIFADHERSTLEVHREELRESEDYAAHLNEMIDDLIAREVAK